MRFLYLFSLIALFPFAMVSCESVANSHPTPEREKLSSMPHNIPASWEGTQGLPGGGAMMR